MKAPFCHISHYNKQTGVAVQVRWIEEEGGGVTWVPVYRVPDPAFEPVVYDRPDLFFRGSKRIETCQP